MRAVLAEISSADSEGIYSDFDSPVCETTEKLQTTVSQLRLPQFTRRWKRRCAVVCAVTILFPHFISAASNLPILEEEVLFVTDVGTFTGTLYAPVSENPVPLVILYHAAGGGSVNFPFYAHLKASLPALGVATFVYNRRGTEGQPGDFNTASFEDLARDGIAALKMLKDDPRIDASRIGAWGISQGGWIAPLASTLSEELSFVISVSGPGVTPAEQMSFTAAFHLREAGFTEREVEQALRLRAEIDAFYRNPVDREYLQSRIDSLSNEPWFALTFLSKTLPEDVAIDKWSYEMDFDPIPTISKMSKPFLVVFGAKDRWVPVADSINAIRAAYPDKYRLSIFVSPQSGHFLSGEHEDSDYMGENLVESEYLEYMAEWIKDL